MPPEPLLFTVLLAIVAIGLVAWVLMSSSEEIAPTAPGGQPPANLLAGEGPHSPSVAASNGALAAGATDGIIAVATTQAETVGATTGDETGDEASTEAATEAASETSLDGSETEPAVETEAGAESETETGAASDSHEGADTNKIPEASGQATTGGDQAKGSTSRAKPKKPENGEDDEAYDPNDEALEQLEQEQKVDDWGKRVAQILKPYRTAARECGKQQGLERGTLINVRLMLAPDGKIIRILPGATTPDDAAFTCVKNLIKDVRFAEKSSGGNVGGGVFAYSFKVY